MNQTNNVFSKMLRIQIIATVIVALIMAVVVGLHGALSALLGGISVIVGAFVAAQIAQRKQSQAAEILINMLKAEAIKILIIVVLLFIIFKVYKQLVPFALIAGLAAAALLSGAAMAKFKEA